VSLSQDEIDVLAERYKDEGMDNPTDWHFAFLVDVADRYVTLLEEAASEDPAPFFNRSTPMEAAMNGLRENLDMRRGDHSG
jgi:hypothetical protein